VSRVANWLIGRITGVKLHDYGCTLKAYRASVIRDSRLYGEMHRFIPVFTSMHGARIAEVVVQHRPRSAGQSKYGYGRIFKVAVDLILVRMLQKYRTKPMHFFGRITQWSWLATVVCLCFAGFEAAISADPWKAFWGKAPLVGLMFFLLGCFAIMLGLVAELAMRAAFEHNAGRYWEEARRVNFGPGGAEWEPHSVPAGEIAAPSFEQIVRQ
jgi:dolichol-phosphate mannosyltransferase